jgi:hypothetical protein
MNTLKSVMISSLIVAGLLIAHSCSGEADPTSQGEFIGSTPGDKEILSKFGLSTTTPIDFIRWKLNLDPIAASSSTFSLEIQFGESQPNTMGFKDGGIKLTIQGSYTISQQNNGQVSGEFYRLTDQTSSIEIHLLQINENLFHILSDQDQLLTGNGGWSYVLNKSVPVSQATVEFEPFSLSPFALTDSVILGVYIGRTNCHTDLLRLHGITGSCNRIKWQLTLYQDPVTHTPAHFEIKTVYVGLNNTVYSKTGSWEVKKGTPSDSNSVFYQLNAEQDNQPVKITLLKADNNILYFTDQDLSLLVGNGDHSYVLNKIGK